MKHPLQTVIRTNARDAGVDAAQPVRMTKQVYAIIRRTLGSRPPETGALLGSSDGGRTIDTIVLDAAAQTSGAVYVPNVSYLNQVLAEWDALGILPVGIIHSHPDGCTVPSVPDLRSAAAYIEAVPAFGGRLELPIVQTASSRGGLRIFWYTAVPDGHGSCRLIPRRALAGEEDVCAPRAEARQRTRIAPEQELFQKVDGLFPTGIARRKTLVVFGAGGSRDWLKGMARIGIGRYVLADGDRIEAKNVATQGVYADEVGLYKTQAAAGDIRRIDPYAVVTQLPCMLDDCLTDDAFARLVGPALLEHPEDVLICGFTDSFQANARAAALAVKFGTPYLQGLVYQGGTVAEIVFSYPGVTRACPRCCQTSRYEAYLSGQVQPAENVSANCPISATAVLNATKLEIAEELLFYGEDCGGDYSTRLKRHADTNLVMLRLAETLPPVLAGSPFDLATREADGSARICGVFWDTVTPDGPMNGAPVCPLCGGTGNLLDSLGRPHDTRRIA